MSGVDSKRSRTIHAGGPAQPRRSRHAKCRPSKRWNHKVHMQRDRLQRRGWHERGRLGCSLLGDASDLKVPVAMVAEQRSRLGRQIRKMLEGFTAGHTANLTGNFFGNNVTCDPVWSTGGRLQTTDQAWNAESVACISDG